MTASQYEELPFWPDYSGLRYDLVKIDTALARTYEPLIPVVRELYYAARETVTDRIAGIVSDPTVVNSVGALINRAQTGLEQLHDISSVLPPDAIDPIRNDLEAGLARGRDLLSFKRTPSDLVVAETVRVYPDIAVGEDVDSAKMKFAPILEGEPWRRGVWSVGSETFHISIQDGVLRLPTGIEYSLASQDRTGTDERARLRFEAMRYLSCHPDALSIGVATTDLWRHLNEIGVLPGEESARRAAQLATRKWLANITLHGGLSLVEVDRTNPGPSQSRYRLHLPARHDD